MVYQIPNMTTTVELQVGLLKAFKQCKALLNYFVTIVIFILSHLPLIDSIQVLKVK
jgi:hypothetical protein